MPLPSKKFGKMRQHYEIVKAHDTITHILLTDELRNQLPREILISLSSNCDVLCWILRHDHNTVFAENLQNSLDWLKSQGYESVRVQ